MHNEVPRAGPRAGGASRPSGLATECLIQAIHDVRGPLNTISILHEVLRASAPADAAVRRDALTAATNSLQALDRMLRRLRGVAGTLATELRPQPLAPALAAALTRAGDRQPRVTAIAVQPPTLAAATCAERLPAMLDLLLACGRAALANGGELQLGAQVAASEAVIELTGSGTGPSLPTPRSLAQLTDADPGPGDWFTLSCLIAGLGCQLELATAEGKFSLRVRLPMPTSTTDAGTPPC